MPDPFKLFGRLFLACFKITSYFFVFLIQMTWYLIFRQPGKIGDAFGDLGRGVADALGDIFR